MQQDSICINKKMARNKKIIFIILIILFILCVLFIISITTLEFLSKKCPKVSRVEMTNCSTLIKKYVQVSENNTSTYPENIFSGSSKTEDDIIKEIVAKRIIEVEQTDIPDLNGIACGSYGFISKDLSGRAKRYVAIHETLHLMGFSSETEVNFKAGKKEPIGLVLTVFHSIFSKFKGRSINDYPCILGDTWRTFKVYFLNSY